MRNKYRGTCYRCGEVVEPGEGHFEKDESKRKWLTQHAECAIAFRGTQVGKGEPMQPRPKDNGSGR